MGLLAAAGAPGWVGAADVDRLGTWHFEPGDSRLPAAVPFVAPALGGRPVAGMLGGGLEFQEGDRPLVLPLSGLRSASTGRGWEPGAVSVRFWYRPSWTTLGRDAGTGPRRPAFLVSAGPASRDGTGPVWELSILPEGRQFELALGEGGLGRRISSRSVACVFDAGRWSEVILSVFRGRARLVFDSATVLEMEVGRWPESPSAWDEGICVGARRDGTGSMLGTLDQMEWRASPMGRVEGLKTGRVFSVEVGAGDASLDLSWRVPGGAKVDLQRRREGAQAWTSLAQVQGRDTYRDAAVQPGLVYDYRLLTNGLDARLTARAGIRIAPNDTPGTLAVVVDETLARALEGDVVQFERDLRAEGWQVVRRTAPRHNDRTWSANTNAIRELRSWLQTEWRSQPGRLRGVYLLGHVVIPYAGMTAEDQHTARGDNHYGAWPADHYYADMDGVWTDEESPPTYLVEPTFLVTRNVPHDGKWDTAWVAPNPAGDTRLELALGRVDFAGMPVLGRSRDAEVSLVRRYLEKARRYRSGGMPSEPRTVAGIYFANVAAHEIARSAFRTATRVFGSGDEAIEEADVFSLPPGRTATWGFVCGPGRIDLLGRGEGLDPVTSGRLAAGEDQPRAPFVMLLGSWFGDWAVGENNLLRAVLASKDHAVGVFWTRTAEWRFDAMARGGTVGDAQRDTANESVRALDPNNGTTRTTYLLGDPTLRLFPMARPRRVRGERRGTGVTLTWDARGGDRDRGEGWLVYRSDTGPRGAFMRRTAEPVGDGRWEDPAAPDRATYLIRPMRLEHTGSGSYTNVGAGEFWPSPG